MSALLFADLPTFDLPLPQDELKLLASLPDWPTTQQIETYPANEMPAARRLEERCLIKVSREKMDPDLTDYRTWFAGRLQSGVQAVSSPSNLGKMGDGE